MIQVCEPLLDGNEEAYVDDCLKTNWISSSGNYIRKFEEMVAKHTGMPYAVAVSSCTAALHLALLTLGIGEGDEVIIPDFTLIVSANTVLYTGAKPVLVDVDNKTWCIDVDQITRKITKKTRAIMAVHMYGHPCDMPSIMKIAKENNLFVIEDCAEAHGAEIEGIKAGAWGDIACFSFYGNKIITTGEGGMVLCKNQDFYEKLLLLRNQGFIEPRFVHEVIGYNYRMTNIQAAIGVAQMEKIEEKISKKRKIAALYNKLLQQNESIITPYEAENAKNVYWMYGILLKERSRITKEEAMNTLKERGIETRSFFCPMHLQPVFLNGNAKNYPDVSGDYPISTNLWKNGFYLPSGLGLSEDDIHYIANTVNEICK